MEGPDIDELVARLRAKVDERRKAGEYPADLEARMAHHFERIAGHRVVPNLDDLAAALEEVKRRLDLRMERTPTDSSAKAGEALHKAMAKLQARQITGALGQVREFGDSVLDALHLMAAALQDATSHVHTDLVGQIDAAVERVSGYERAPASSAEAVADLRRRVEELEQAERARRFVPWFSGEDLAEEFEGARHEVVDGYRSLAARFAGNAPVLDLAPGRGEFLEALRDAGVEARGADGPHDLAAVPDQSLGGIVLTHAGRLSPQALVDLAVVARDKLREGGLLVVVAPNPQSLYGHAHDLFADPRNVQFVHPAYLAFVFQQAGFSTEIVWRSEPPQDEAADAALSRLLFAPQEYALLASR